MLLDPWYRVVTLRNEVSEGRSFSPDEFEIALAACLRINVLNESRHQQS